MMCRKCLMIQYLRPVLYFVNIVEQQERYAGLTPRSDLLSYLLTYIHTYLLTYLFTY